MTDTYITKRSFKFCGIDMYQKFGIYFSGPPEDALIPSLRSRKATIPNRSGAYDFGAKYYDERQITLPGVVPEFKGISDEDVREMAYFLSKKGRLYIWTDPTRYYIGRLYDSTGLTKTNLISNEFPLVFTCEPFAYRNIITERFTDNVYISNYQGTAVTPTRIEITNNNAVAAASIRIVQVRKIESEG